MSFHGGRERELAFLSGKRERMVLANRWIERAVVYYNESVEGFADATGYKPETAESILAGVRVFSDSLLEKKQAEIEELRGRVAMEQVDAPPRAFTHAGAGANKVPPRVSVCDGLVRVAFGSKPAEEVIRGLKEHGFRWVKAIGGWEARSSQASRDFAHGLISNGFQVEGGDV